MKGSQAMEVEGAEMLKRLLPSKFEYRAHEFKILEEFEEVLKSESNLSFIFSLKEAKWTQYTWHFHFHFHAAFIK